MFKSCEPFFVSSINEELLGVISDCNAHQEELQSPTKGKGKMKNSWVKKWLNQTFTVSFILVTISNLVQYHGLFLHWVAFWVSCTHVLSCTFQRYGSLQDVLVSFGRRVLCYPLYRHFAMVSAAIRDTTKILQSGESPRSITQPAPTPFWRW